MASYANERNLFSSLDNPFYMRSPFEITAQANNQNNPKVGASFNNRDRMKSTYVPSTTESSDQSEGSSTLVDPFASMIIEDRPLPLRPPHDRLVLSETGEELEVEAELREGEGELEPDEEEEEVYESMTQSERERALDQHNFRMQAQFYLSQLTPGLMDSLTVAQLKDLMKDAQDSLERRDQRK